MRARQSHVWAAVHHERVTLIHDLEGLTPGQWSAPTACAGWDVHDVLAHLVDTAKTTRLGFVRGMIAARFDFDRQNALGLARERREDPKDTLAALRSALARTDTPPAPIATRLVEAFVHGEDIRRAIGRRGTYPADHVAAALDHQLRTTVKMGGGRERARGLRLAATDAAIDTGSGPLANGTAVALLLAVSGRPFERDELTGPGAATLAERTTL